MMKFQMSEYINPEFTEVTVYGKTYRNINHWTWESIERFEMEMEPNEMVLYLIERSKEGRFIEAVHDNLVWCNSYNYSPMMYKKTQQKEGK